MKRLLLIAAALLAATGLSAQDYKSRYELLTKRVGYSGVGVETVLTKWEAEDASNPEVYRGWFNFYFSKSAGKSVVSKPDRKYLGNKPLLTLKDSTGVDVNYFEINTFVDSLFTLGIKSIDRAIELAPSELSYRIEKITALMDYGGESPDLAVSELMSLIDMNKSQSPKWKFNGSDVDEDDFAYLVQEYCGNFYKLGTPLSYESFLAVSQKMRKAYPKYSDFVSNIGTYWLVVKQNDRKAASFYKKALKINPEDKAAARNLKIIEQRKK